ncbi:MAG: type II toxin-antitoxin system RelE/ParE family toxin [Rhodobacteraceae bacterium]|nr:type II toxin-antitoxin system RelE/ParE family toxin [Paracoccaceae bacterium]
MIWKVIFNLEFKPEFNTLPQEVQNKIFALAEGLLSQLGPSLGRPHVDTLTGSKYPNMKELRCTVANGVWRIAFAFDPDRQAILLAGGSKSGVSEKRFYKALITQADSRFDRHLERRRRRKR